MSAGEWLDTYPGVRAEEPLAKHSQFGVGGPAQWFTTTRDAAALVSCSDVAGHGDPVTMLGAGSNALISDAGIRGLVIRHDDRTLRVVDDEPLYSVVGP